MSHPLSLQHRFLRLRAHGLTYDAIARKLSVGRHTLIDWGRKFKPLLDNLRTVRLEAIQDQCLAIQEKRIQLLGRKLQAVLAELDTRDLRKIPTAKLFDLALKLTAALKKEQIPQPDIDLPTDMLLPEFDPLDDDPADPDLKPSNDSPSQSTANKDLTTNNNPTRTKTEPKSDSSNNLNNLNTRDLCELLNRRITARANNLKGTLDATGLTNLLIHSSQDFLPTLDKNGKLIPTYPAPPR